MEVETITMSNTTQITLELPTELLQTTQSLIKAGKASSLDELITQALQYKLSQLQRDQVFSNSNNDLSDDDPIYQLGKNPISSDITDGSVNIDRYLYDSPE